VRRGAAELGVFVCVCVCALWVVANLDAVAKGTPPTATTTVVVAAPSCTHGRTTIEAKKRRPRTQIRTLSSHGP
jgi:hypothetical protein